MPVVGRTFSDEETERSRFNNAAAPIGTDPVVMLSHTVWMQRFGGDPHVVGRIIVIDRRSFRVVGVMPQGSPCRTAAFNSGFRGVSTIARAISTISGPWHASKRGSPCSRPRNG